MKIKTWFSKKLLAIFKQILYVSFHMKYKEMKNLLIWCWSHDQDGAPRPYMLKTLKKSSSFPEPVDWFPWNFVFSICNSSPSKFVQNEDPGLTLAYIMARSNLVI